MANEITVSSAADLFASEVLANEYLMLLADRDPSILNHPAIFKATASSTNSNVIAVPHVGLGGYDLLTPHTPGSEIANTALTDDSTDVTLAHRTKRYSMTDMARYVTQGILGPPAFAQDLVIASAQTMISLIAGITATFTATSGATGVALTWAKVLEAKAKLGAAQANGPLLMVVHPVTWGQLEANALGLGVVAAETNAGIVNSGLQAYKGRWFGIDCFVSAHCPLINSDADYAGGLFGPGALAYADQALVDEADPNIRSFGVSRLERVREGGKQSTSYVFSYVSGASKAIDAAGVKLFGDA